MADNFLFEAPKPQEDPNQYYFSGEVSPSVLPDETVKQRASKYDVAMGPYSPGVDQLSTNIQTGADEGDRMRLAQKKGMEMRALQMRMLDQFVREKGAPATTEDMEFALSLTQEQLQNPNTIFETEYAKKAISNATMGGENPTLQRALAESPEEAHTQLDQAEGAVAFKEGIQKILEGLEAQQQDQSWAGWAFDYAETWMPMASWSNTLNAVEGAPREEGVDRLAGLLPGTNKQRQYDYLRFLPLDQGLAEAQLAADKMAGDNLEDAITFFRGMLDYTSAASFIDNTIGVVDLTAVGGAAVKVGKGVAAAKSISHKTKAAGEVEAKVAEGLDATAATPAQQSAKALTDTLKPLLKRNSDPVEVLAAAGHTEEAATLGAVDKLKQLIGIGLRDTDRPGAMESFRTAIPSIFNTDSWMALGAKTFSMEAQRRIVNTVIQTTPALLKSLTSGLRIDRLNDSEKMLAALVTQAKDTVKLQYPNLVDTIMDVRPSYNEVTNTRAMGIQFGDENAALFKYSQTADKAAIERGFSGYRIKQQGAGYYIEVIKPVNETDPIIRNLLIETGEETPRSLATSFIGMLRSPEDLVSKIANEDRKSAVYGTGELTTLVKESAARIGSLPKKGRRNLATFIENDRVHETTYTVGNKTPQKQVGRFATTLSEFEGRWYDTFGSYPSEAEAVAYLEYVRLSDLDWAFRNFRVYRDKARVGTEIFDFTYTATSPQGAKTAVQMANIEGRTVKEIPWGETQDAGILILKEGDPKFVRKNDSPASLKAEVEDLLSKGYRIHQIAPFGEKALKRTELIQDLAGEDKIHFVLTDKYAAKPLPISQLPNSPGGHILYPDGFYVAQPSVTRIANKEGVLREHRYDGDTNVMQFTSEAKAKKFANVYDTVRVMIKQGVDDSTIDKYILTNLDKDPTKVKALFRDTLDTGGAVIKKAQLRLDEKIDVRFAGERLGDKLDLKSSYSNFIDSRDDAYNMYSDANLEYTGTRNSPIETIEEAGTEANPIFNTRPAKMVDAFTTMNRAMQGMVEARFLDDIKLKEVEKFAKEFGHLLKTSPEELARNPLRSVMNPQFKEGLAGPEYAAAQNSLMALRQFLGQETMFSKNLRWVKQKVLNSVYNRFGDKAVDIVEPLMMYTTKDPAKYARGLAFHIKLGLFNPVQLFLQAQTFTHMAGIAGPVIAAKSGPASLFMRGLRFTDEDAIISKFAQNAKAYGWKEEDFKEAYNLMRESGIDRVAGEVAMRDDVMDPELIQTTTGKFANWSTFFFNEGERFTRIAAYNAAYLEWRGANPLAKVSMKVKREILNRADLMAGNMTRASNASWQRGFASIPTQFFAYQARIGEQLLGKRLTGLEKARVLGMYSMMYGVPVAASAGTIGWPWAETLRSQLIERGIDYDDNVISRTIVDGLVSTIIQASTGTKYNVGERYGPNGLQTFRDFLSGEKSGAEILLGVSGSTAGDMITAAWPVLNDVADVFRDTNDNLPLLLEDMVDFTKSISSANNVLKTIYGLNFGKYITKNEIYMTDVTPGQSVFMGLAGLTPQEVPDAFAKASILKEMDKAKQEASKEAIKYIRRGLRADSDEDRKKNFTRAKLYIQGAGMNIKESAATFAAATKNYTSFVNSANQRFGNSTPERMEQYIEAQKQKVSP